MVLGDKEVVMVRRGRQRTQNDRMKPVYSVKPGRDRSRLKIVNPLIRGAKS